MPSSILGSLSMHSTVRAGELAAVDADAPRAGWLDGAALDSGTSTEKREPRPGVERRSMLWSSTRAMRSHDRQAEAEAARHLGAFVEPVEFAEDQPLLRLRNAEPGVVDVDAQLAAARAGSRPARGRFGVYLIALETRFCSSRRSRRRSERTASEQGTKRSSRPFSRASGANSTSSWRSKFVDAEADELRPHRAGIEARNIEQRAENLLDRLERSIDIADQLSVLAARPAARSAR